jgi:hypothetical protein
MGCTKPTSQGYHLASCYKTQPLNEETLPLTRATNLPSSTQTLPNIGILPLTSNTLPLDGGFIDRILEQEEVEMDSGACVELANAITDNKGSPNNKIETLQNLCKPSS